MKRSPYQVEVDFLVKDINDRNPGKYNLNWLRKQKLSFLLALYHQN